MTNLSQLVEALAKQALGGQSNSQQNSQQQSSTAGGLGGLIGQMLGGAASQNTQAGGGNPFGQILGTVLGGGLGGGNSGTGSNSNSNATSAILVAVIPMVLSWIQKQGGLSSALSKLNQSGLGSKAQSWVSPDQAGSSISNEEVQQLFDGNEIEQVAAQHQVPASNIYSAIATALPQVIDSLTPQGNNTDTKEANNDIQSVIDMISQIRK